MKRGFVVLLLVLLSSGAALSQQAPAAEPKAAEQKPAAETLNLFVDTGGGLMLPDGEDSTPLYYAAINYALPAIPEYGVGGQIGGKFTLRDNDPDWLAQAGLFQRGVDYGFAEGAWSLQGVYQNTWLKADLLSLKPTFGFELDESNSLAVTGIWGIREETVGRFAGGKVVQQTVDTAMLLWGASWNDALRTEVGAGYEFQDVDSVLLGLHAGYTLNDMTSVILTYSFDFEDNYYAAAGLSFDLGEKGRNATFNNISVVGNNAYTPFPLGSLPVMFYETTLGNEPVGAGPS